jgi:hypothetical protein
VPGDQSLSLLNFSTFFLDEKSYKKNQEPSNASLMATGIAMVQSFWAASKFNLINILNSCSSHSVTL